jgi:hypothetical protein
MQEQDPYIMWFLGVFEVGLIKISVPISSLKFLFCLEVDVWLKRMLRYFLFSTK